MKFFVPTVIVGVAVVCAFAVPPKTIGIANATAKAALTARRACLRTTADSFQGEDPGTLATSLPGLQGG